MNHDHSKTDLPEMVIVQPDPENGPSVDALLKKHKQGLIKRSENNGWPNFAFIPTQGFACLDCRPHGAIMSEEMLEWHCLTK